MGTKPIPVELLCGLEECLVRCGIYEPFEKIYVKNCHEFISTDMGRLMAILLIAQLSRLQICITTGDLITKKPGENIDGYPFLIGIYTLLRQSKTENIEIFINFLCKFTKVTTLNKLKSTESINEGILLIRILQLFCETFSYSFSKIEDKLPMVLLTQMPQK